MIVFAYGFGYNLGHDHYSNEYSAGYHENYAADRIERECIPNNSSSFELHECIQEQIQASTEHQAAYADLQSQERMAFWAVLMGVFTGLTVLVTGVGVIFVYQTLSETRKLVLDTQKIGQAQTRAYLHLDEPKMETIRNGGGFLNFAVQTVPGTPIQPGKLNIRQNGNHSG